MTNVVHDEAREIAQFLLDALSGKLGEKNVAQWNMKSDVLDCDSDIGIRFAYESGKGRVLYAFMLYKNGEGPTELELNNIHRSVHAPKRSGYGTKTLGCIEDACRIVVGEEKRDLKIVFSMGISYQKDTQAWLKKLGYVRSGNRPVLVKRILLER